jgi:hypothetical protein
MAWTFRRQIKLGPINLNFSRSGIGASAGAGPFRTGVDAKGRHYTNVRGPFGVYNRQYHTPSPAAGQQTTPTPAGMVAKDSLVAFLFSLVCVIGLASGALQNDHGWIVFLALLSGIPALLGLAGYVSQKDPTTGWFKAIAGVVSIEKWLILGAFILVALALASPGGRKRR